MKRFSSCLYKKYSCTLREYEYFFIVLCSLINYYHIVVQLRFVAKRYASTSKKNAEPKTEIVAYQNNLFNNEQKRQRESIGRIEKIIVKYNGVPESVVLNMNKRISTPYHCTKRKWNYLLIALMLLFVYWFQTYLRCWYKEVDWPWLMTHICGTCTGHLNQTVKSALCMHNIYQIHTISTGPIGVVVHSYLELWFLKFSITTFNQYCTVSLHPMVNNTFIYTIIVDFLWGFQSPLFYCILSY